MKKKQFCLNLLQSQMQICEDFPENLRNIHKCPENFHKTTVQPS